jgi:hypothetical protein
MKQTAVEWLESELDFLYQYMAERDRSKLFEQAKAMEKEQIMNAYNAGESDGDHYEDSSLIYYIDTFKIK